MKIKIIKNDTPEEEDKITQLEIFEESEADRERRADEEYVITRQILDDLLNKN